MKGHERSLMVLKALPLSSSLTCKTLPEKSLGQLLLEAFQRPGPSGACCEARNFDAQRRFADALSHNARDT